MARDLFDRNHGNIVVGDIAKKLLAPVNNTVVDNSATEPESESRTDELLDRLYAAVNNVAQLVDGDAVTELNDSKEWASSLNEVAAILRGSKGDTRKDDKNEDANIKLLGKVAEATDKLWKASQSQNTFWVSISSLSNRAMQDIASSIRLAGCCGAATESISKAGETSYTGVGVGVQGVTGAHSAALNDRVNSSGGGGDGGSGGGPTLPGSGGRDEGKSVKNWMMVAGTLKYVAGAMERVHRNIVDSLKVNPLDKIFSGALVDSNTFRESMRAIVHAQEGFGNANAELENRYKEVTQQVLSSGIERGKYQAIYLKNLERGLAIATAEEKLATKGLKSVKQEAALSKASISRMLGVQTNAIATADALHMNAEMMNELFMDWHYHVGLSENSLSEMGRHMKHLGRQTGLTGAQMESVMRSSDQIVKNLKKSGVASIDVTKNVTAFMAASQKTGFEGGADMMQTLGSRQGFLESDQKVFWAKAAGAYAEKTGDTTLMDDLNQGLVLEKDGSMEKLMMGQEELHRQILRQYGPVLNSLGYDAETMDVSNLSGIFEDLRKNGFSNMASNMQRQFSFLGMDAGEAERSLQAGKEFSMKPFQLEEKYNQQLADLKAEGLEGFDEWNRVQSLLREHQTDMSLDAFGRMEKFSSDIAANGGVISGDIRDKMSTDLSSLFGSKDSADKWLQDLGKNTSNVLNTVNERGSAVGVDFNEALSRRGIEGGQAELASMLQSGDQIGIRAFNEVAQEIARAERAAQDPMTGIRKTLESLNNTLGAISDKLGFGFSDLAVKMMYIGGYLGSILFDILSTLAIFKGLQALMGGGLAGKGVATSVKPPKSPTGKWPANWEQKAAASNVPTPKTSVAGKALKAAGKAAKFGGPIGAAISGLFLASDLYDISKKQKSGALNEKQASVARGGAVGSAAGGTGGALAGAAGGAAIGSVVPVIGTLIGGLVGSVIGGIAGSMGGKAIGEWVMDSGKAVYDYIIEPLLWVGKVALAPLVAGYQMLAGVITGDMSRVLEGIVGFFLRIPDLLIKLGMRFVPLIMSGLLSIPGLIVAALVDLPAKLWNSITSGLTSLSTNEWVGPIFEPILGLWTALGDTIGTVMGPIGKSIKWIYNTASDAFSGITSFISGMFSPIGKLLSSIGFIDEASGAFDLVKGAAFLLGKVLKALASIIGFILKVALSPLTLAIKLIGGVIGWLAKGLKSLSSLIGSVITAFLTPLKYSIKAIGFAFGLLGKSIEVSVDAFKGILSGITSVAETLFKLPLTLASFAYSVLSFFATLPFKIIAGIGKLSVWLASSLMSGLSSIGTWLYKTITGGIGAIGTWLYDTFVGGLASVGTWMYETITSALSNLGNWIYENVISAVVPKDAAVAISQTPAQQAMHMSENGASLAHGMGGVAGGAKEILKGNIRDGVSKIGIGAKENAMWSMNKTWNGVKAVGSAINPLNYFSKGTRYIEQGGVAVLHPGEMVVPENVWEKVKAAGSGPFGAGGDVISKFTGSAVTPSLGLTAQPDANNKVQNDISSPLTAKIEKLFEDMKNTLHFIGSTIAGAAQSPATAGLGSVASSLTTKTFETISNISSGVYSQITDVLSSTIGSVKNASDTVVGFAKTGAALGSTALSTITNTVQLPAKVLQATQNYASTKVSEVGGLMSVAKLGISDVLSNAFSSVKDKAKAAVGYVNMGVFDQNNPQEAQDNSTTNMVQRTIETMGLSHVADFIQAVASKAINQSQNYITNASKTVGDSLVETHNTFSESKKGVSSYLNMGVFDTDKPDEANDSHTSSLVKQMYGASSADLNNVVSSIIDTSRDSITNQTRMEKNIVAEVSRSLDYETSASDIASEVKTNMLDYRDEIRGEVGTMGLSRVSMESAVAQSKYGDQPSGGTAILPSMDSIAEYLVSTQAAKLDDMIDLLASIRDRLAVGPSGSQLIGSNVRGASPPTRAGVKNIARDMTRGNWDLTYGSYSTGTVTTEGRGGN